MSDFKLINNDNTWSGELKDFNLNVAMNFYSYGVPSGYDKLTQGGGGKLATIVFQSEDFFRSVVDSKQNRNMNTLSPRNFAFVDKFSAEKATFQREPIVLRICRKRETQGSTSVATCIVPVLFGSLGNLPLPLVLIKLDTSKNLANFRVL